jgi:chromosome segregation ATPase
MEPAPDAPAPGKLTIGELKQKHAQLVERCKTQKQKIDQLLQNQKALQDGVRERDAVIESRDKSIEEFRRIYEESVARMQAKDLQLAELFKNLADLQSRLKSQCEKSDSISSELSTLKSDAAAMTQTIATLTSENELLTKQLSGADSQLIEKNVRLEAEVVRLQSEQALLSISTDQGDSERLSQLSAELAAVKGDLTTRIENERRLTQSLQELRLENEQLKLAGNANFDVGSELKANSIRIFDLENQLQQAQQTNDQLQAASKDQVDDFQRRFKKASEKVEAFEGLNQVLKGELNAVKSERDAQISSLNSQLARHSATVKEQEAKIDSLTKQLAKMSDDYSKLVERVKAEAQSQISRLQASDDGHLKSVQRLQSEKAQLESQVTSLSLEKLQLNDSLQKSAFECTTLKGQVAELLEEKAALEAKVHTAASGADEARNKLQSQLSRLDDDYQQVKLQLTKNDFLCQSLTNERDRLLGRNEQLQDENRELKQKIKLQEKDLNDLRQQLAKLRADFQASDEGQHQLQTDFDTFRRRSNEQMISLRNQLEEMRNLNEDLEARSRMAESEVATWKTTSEYAERDFRLRLEELTKSQEMNASLVEKLTKQKQKSGRRRKELVTRLKALEAAQAELHTKYGALKKDLAEQSGSHGAAVFPAYIRKVLLQFFIQDGSTREAMIPLILTLVECDEKLIQ